MSSKVFEDLGFSPEEAAALKLKTDLHTRVVKYAGRYSQQELQTILGASQPRISDLLRGKMSKFSLEMLVIYAEKLGLHTQIRTTAFRKQSRPQRASSAGTAHFAL
jgi:predicted XRE-type DNA-binding protein